ncbi:SDR family NAD(P)-dependent oxidoreductase [Bacillus marinisedimentorum]|uniref:SDR family NAD(P)-dependent oxidoreductase n=1 Tax=Bacillus marinisedimentorum TaxID=1821260 RepID=UPI0008726D03|nr:SDR family oxidoreductase [Bacillus marinisedimentorum]
MANILITGAGTGLGKELALQYAVQGHTLFLLGRTKQKLDTAKQQIEEKGGKAKVVVCDLADRKQVKDTIGMITETDSIDWLINNAGAGHFGALADLTDDEIEKMIDTNMRGTIYMTKDLLPHLLGRPSAKVMNIISTAGLRGKVNESVYCATKFAVRGFTESLVKELEDTPVAVTAVYMGGMDTPFWSESDHVKDPSRLKSPAAVAEMIVSQDDGQAEIFIDK